MMQKQKRWYQTGKAIFILLVLFAYGFIIQRLINFSYWGEIKQSLSAGRHILLISLALILLWLINIFSETKKWQCLMLPYHKLSFKNALMQVLAGNITAVASPGRIAEPGGRIILLPHETRVKAIIMTTIGGMMQNVIIIFTGIVSLLIPASPLLKQLNINNIINTLSVSIFTVLTITLVITLVIKKIWGDKLRYYLLTLKKLSRRIIAYSSIWTLVRYITYNIQLFFWMHFYGIDISWQVFILTSPVYFLIITIIPSYFLADIGIRGSASLVIFGLAGFSEPHILAAIISQWITNIAIPSLLGSVVILRYKVIDQKVT